MPALRTALEWIAGNDEGAELDPAVIAESVTLLLVADLWKKEPDELARKVVRLRRRAAREAKAAERKR